MKVTPLDIRKKQFEKVTFGGYNKEDVNAYMQALSQAWETLFQRNNEMDSRLAANTQELNRLREIESTLLRQLKDVQDSNHVTRQNAKKEAELIVYESQIKANQVLEDARMKAKTLMRNANQQVYQAFGEMREEMRKLDYSCRLLEKQRDTLINEMRTFIKDTVVKIEQVEAHKRTIFYEDEIKKANQFMAQVNESVRQEVKDIDQHSQLPKTDRAEVPKTAPQNEPRKEMSKENKSSLDSFFDTL
jgi:cell division initiation protein